MKKIYIIIALILWCSFTKVLALNPEIQYIDSGRINIEEELKPLDDTLPLYKKDNPEILAKTRDPKEPTLLLNKVIIKDALALTENELIAVATPKLGHKVTIFDLQYIAKQMTILYRTKGFILSQVILPPQNIENGIVEFKVIEGFIEKVYIDNNQLDINTSIINKYSSAITNSFPLNFTVLERALVLSNSLPGITVKSYIQPSKAILGAATLTIRIEDRKKLENFVSYDNKIDKQYGPWQATIGSTLNFANLTDKTQILARTSNHQRVKLVYLAHTHFLPQRGDYIIISAQAVRTKPFFADPAILPILGNTKSLSFAYEYPVIKLRSKELLLISKFELLDTRSRGQRVFIDRLRSLRLGITYRFIDKFYGSNSIGAELSKGLNVLGATSTPHDKGDVDKVTYSRPGGKSNYTKLNLHATRMQYLPKNFSLLIALEGQWSAKELLSSEEFGFGGYRFGRGYESSSFVADKGIVAKLEPRYDYQVNKRWLEKVQPYIFYDVGFLYDKSGIKLRENPNGQASVTKLRTDSAGFGIRASLTSNLFAEACYSKPLGKQNKLGNKKQLMNFSINYSW